MAGLHCIGVEVDDDKFVAVDFDASVDQPLRACDADEPFNTRRPCVFGGSAAG